MGSPFFASPFRRQRKPRRSSAGAGSRALSAEAQALLKLHEPALEATRAQRDALVEQFVVATASILTHSPLRDHFLRLGMCADPGLRHLSLNDQMLVEFRTWMPTRQHAALRLLCFNPFLTSVVLNGCALEDSAGAVLAEVLSCSTSISALSVERNDLREDGLLALVETLRTNRTLKELRVNHQKFTVTTPVEEALHDILHNGHNTTLCKLGLIVRNDVPRNRIENALMRNIDAGRAARHREATRLRGERGDVQTQVGGTRPELARASTSLASMVMAGGGREPIKKRQLSAKLAGFAAGLEGALVAFDVEGLVEILQQSKPLPSGLTGEVDVTARGAAAGGAAAGGGGSCLNLNNDTKFARCTAQQKEAVIRALAGNTSVSFVEMANVQLSDSAAYAWAEVLRANQQIRSLNLEGNLLSSSGLSALAASLQQSSLVELKLDHQVGAVCSATAELELAKAVDGLRTLQKFSYSMRNVQSRDLVERAMLRNRDQLRLRRLQTRKLEEAAAEDDKSRPKSVSSLLEA